MIRGFVNEHDEPIIQLQLGLSQREIKRDAVIDTGFNGYISVPKPIVQESGWDFLGSEEYELASGELIVADAFLGKIVFDGKNTVVYALASDTADILIGTKLLRNKVLTIDFGRKTISVAES